MSFIAKAGGFVLVPGLLSRVAIPRTVNASDTLEKTGLKCAAVYAAIAAASYYAAKHAPSEALSEFAVGATWGAGIAAATCALGPYALPANQKDRTLASFRQMYGLTPADQPARPVLPQAAGYGSSSGVATIVAALTGH